MGCHLFNVRCTKCAFEGIAREGPSGCCYELPDGNTAVVTSAPAWCTDCATTVDAEQFSSVDDIKRELESFESDGPAAQSFLKQASRLTDPGALLAFHIDSLRASFKWRSLRRSAPRCLRCGSHRIAYLDREPGVDLSTLRHPSCGGMLRLSGFAHASLPLRSRMYSVEGERQDEDEDI